MSTDSTTSPARKQYVHNNLPGNGLPCTYRCEPCGRNNFLATSGRIRRIGRSLWFTCHECIAAKAAAKEAV